MSLNGVATRPAGGSRAPNVSVDVLRLVCAFVIVVFHAGAPGGALMPAAMGIFTALLTYYSARTNPDRTLRQQAQMRGARLLRPFLVWALIYIGLRVASATFRGQDVAAHIAAWFPPQGTMGQLWFLPWAFAVSLVTFMLRPKGGKLAPPPLVLAVTAFAAAATLFVLKRLADGQIAPGYMVFLAYLPSALFGYALAWLPASRGWLAGAALLAFATGAVFAPSLPGLPLQMLIGMPLVSLALAFPFSGHRFLHNLSDIAMAVYLVHVAVLGILLNLAPELRDDRATLALMAVAVSLIAALLIRKTRLREYLI